MAWNAHLLIHFADHDTHQPVLMGFINCSLMEMHQVTSAFCPTACAASAPQLEAGKWGESRNGCLYAQLVVEPTHLNDMQLKGVEIEHVRNHHLVNVSVWRCHAWIDLRISKISVPLRSTSNTHPTQRGAIPQKHTDLQALYINVNIQIQISIAQFQKIWIHTLLNRQEQTNHSYNNPTLQRTKISHLGKSTKREREKENHWLRSARLGGDT